MKTDIKSRKAISIWLMLVITNIYLIILVGGLTRLTDSGLSMVDWRPIMGTIPPITEQEWTSVFEAYKQFPEYQKINLDMSLTEFKEIFYWEYGHRVLGRLSGILFLIPFIFFLVRKRIPKALTPKFLVAFVLGGAQGLLGWYMVKSGLVHEPRVSQYRLAAHLSLALFLLSFLYWILLDLRSKSIHIKIPRGTLRTGLLLLLFTILQIIYGAFTAGLDAGLIYNTFPDLNGQYFPSGLLAFVPQWKNLFENPLTVQYIHRCLAFVVLGLSLYQAVASKTFDNKIKALQWALFITILAQFSLGVLTLVHQVPISIASMHQIGATVVLLLNVTNIYFLRKYRI